MRWLVVLFVIGGCHKLFELRHVPDEAHDDAGGDDDDALSPDADPCLVIYDDDGDSIDDRCDACPTVASSPTPPDTDTDAVPDACDPDLAPQDRDSIDLVATFAEQAELANKFAVVNAVWDAGDNGTVTLTGPASIETLAVFAPTRIVVGLMGASASSFGAQLHIVTTGLTCRVLSTDCAGTSSAATCVAMVPQTGGGAGEIGSGFGGLRGVVLEQPGNSLCQVAMTNGSVTSTSQSSIGFGRVKVAATADTVVKISSVTIYGAK